VSGSSGAGFVEGSTERTPLIFAAQYDFDPATITTETNALCVRMSYEHHNVEVTSEALLLSVSVSADTGTKPVTARLYYRVDSVGASTTSDFPVWVNLPGAGGHDSLLQVATNSITRTGGQVVMVTSVAKDSATEVDLTPYDLVINRGEISCVTVESSNANSPAVSLVWNELI